MKKNEIIFISVALAFMLCVYFIVEKKISQPPEKKQTPVFGEQQAESEGDFDAQEKYYESHSAEIETSRGRSMREIQKSVDGAQPYLKQAQEYNKEWEEVSKLPEKEQERRNKEIIENKQKESKKNRQFNSKEEMDAYFETLRKNYPGEYSKYKKMIENE